MTPIKVHDKFFVPYITADQIQHKIEDLAQALHADYAEKKPLFIAVLNGAFMLAADLFKHLNFEAEICFIKLASYKGAKSSGHVITAIGLDTDIINRHIVILEDILDTGKTLHAFLPQITNQQPLSVKIAVLLHKPQATVYPVKIDYCGFTIADKFVVGYGLDYNGLGRNLDSIYQLQEENEA